MQYRGGTILTYSCNFSTPWEGFILGMNGTKGRIEIRHHSNPDPTGGASEEASDEITVLPLFGGRETIKIATVTGGHGGADGFLLRDIFVGSTEQSKTLSLAASSYEGAVAVCQGEAVYRSLSSGQTVSIADLLGEQYRPA